MRHYDDMPATDYQRIEQAIHYLERRATRQPGLEDVARQVGLSPFHFQRLFTRWAGVSPKRFLQLVTVEQAKRLLRDSGTVLDATYGTGLSSPGRLHDLFVAVEAMTPGEYKALGAGLEIRFGVHPSPFGDCLIAVAPRGICHMGFVEAGERSAAIEALHAEWARADIREAPTRTAPLVKRIFDPRRGAGQPLRLLLKGTNFRVQVWRALLRIPEGVAVAYADVARAVDRPDAVRAVASAIARNPVAFLIPCHRVLRSTGAAGGYRWGAARKRLMLGWEAARLDHASPRSA